MFELDMIRLCSTIVYQILAIEFLGCGGEKWVYFRDKVNANKNTALNVILETTCSMDMVLPPSLRTWMKAAFISTSLAAGSKSAGIRNRNIAVDDYLDYRSTV